MDIISISGHGSFIAREKRFLAESDMHSYAAYREEGSAKCGLDISLHIVLLPFFRIIPS